MKTKNDRGITLVALIITIILLALITSVSVSMGLSIAESARFENIETYLLLIKSKAKMLSEGLAMGEIDESQLRGQKQVGGDYDGWYKLSQGDLDSMGVSKAAEEDGYYVDYNIDNNDDDEVDVMYARGIALDNKVFYRLSEILSYTNKE